VTSNRVNYDVNLAVDAVEVILEDLHAAIWSSGISTRRPARPTN
jgi:hypothetical protein